MSRIQRRFSVKGHPGAVAERLREMKWQVQGGEGDRIEARQGSQAKTRLLGGWFVDARHLPKRLVAERTAEATEVCVEEALGVGLMDPKLRGKYEEAFAELERQFGG